MPVSGSCSDISITRGRPHNLPRPAGRPCRRSSGFCNLEARRAEEGREEDGHLSVVKRENSLGMQFVSFTKKGNMALPVPWPSEREVPSKLRALR